MKMIWFYDMQYNAVWYVKITEVIAFWLKNGSVLKKSSDIKCIELF